MPTSKKTPASKKRGYHHGDLRRALIDAAWGLLREGGSRALTLREVARAVGVTHAAPYHHFPTHASLLDALAEDAFVGLEAAMRLAKRSG
ncbi:MAG TPA: helix-turn-helix domain-containing protein, partial [Polyangiales bacterium]